MDINKLKEIKERRFKEIGVRFGVPSSKKKYEILVCTSTGCLGYNSKHLIDVLNQEINDKNMGDVVTVTKTGCFGLCALGPIVIVYPDCTFYVKADENFAKRILTEHIQEGNVLNEYLYTNVDNLKVKTKNEIEFYKKQMFIARNNSDKIDPENIEDYIAIDGYAGLHKALTTFTPQELNEEIKKSGLRGRGGAGFLTGLKWELTLPQKADKKYLICNADEGDPGAFMDRSIIESNPHKVIEGMILAGYGVGASHGIVYVRSEYPLAESRLTIAINQARELGLLGDNIFGTGHSFDIEIKKGASAFVCGEETALIQSVEGKRGEPITRPPYPSVKGVFDKPTAINNVETLANVAEIVLKGADWYNSIGTEKSKGTKVFALSGKIKNTGLIELPMGTTLREIIYDIGGGIPKNKEFKAVLTGGPSGGCISKDYLDTKVDYENLVALGSMMGSGGMIVMDEDTCMVDIAKFFLSFTCDESCGKCTPCRIGNTRLYEILNKITEGKGELSDLDELETLSNYIKANSLCGLGQSSPNPILSTLKDFREEYIEHIVNHRCPAGVCKSLSDYYIIEEKCVGCSACSRVCPVNAISGEIRKKYKIDKSICINCGLCYKTCRFNAISSSGVQNG